MKKDFTKREAGQYLGVMKMDNDLVRLVDPVARMVTGEEETGTVCHGLWGRCERCENCTSLRALQTEGQAYKLETLRGRTYWVHSRFLQIDGNPCVAEIVRDITANLLMDSDEQDKIGTLITNYNGMLITDSLTGVYNRRFLDEHFIPSLSCCHEQGITVNVAFLDMDGFKKVNDRYGHGAGDRLLKDVAGFWRLHFDSREKNRERLVVRYGGDELLVIACGVPRDQFEAEILRCDGEMRKICYCDKGVRFRFDFTIGIASGDLLAKDWSWEELVELADRRMYDAKKGKK